LFFLLWMLLSVVRLSVFVVQQFCPMASLVVAAVAVLISLIG